MSPNDTLYLGIAFAIATVLHIYDMTRTHYRPGCGECADAKEHADHTHAEETAKAWGITKRVRKSLYVNEEPKKDEEEDEDDNDGPPMTPPTGLLWA